MTIDPSIAAFLSGPVPPELLDQSVPVSRRRRAMEVHQAAMTEIYRPGRDNAVAVEDLVISTGSGDVAIRLYRPSSAGVVPGYLFFFGGSFWMRNFDSPDVIAACTQTSAEAGVAVVQIDYALAPEHPYPKALLQGQAVLEWMSTSGAEFGIDPTRLAVGGQSAGATLAAGVALWARDTGGPSIKLQVLEVPALDLSGQALGDPALPRIDRQLLQEMRDFYLPVGIPEGDTYASPIGAADFAGLPPTLLLLAENDSIRPQGEEFAGLLMKAGVTTVVVTYGGQVHVSPSLGGISAGARAWRGQISWALRGLWERPTVL